MTSMNQVTLMGILTKDPTVRQVNGGSSVADLSMAINDRYKNRQGEQVDTTCFVDVDAWNKQAEVCGQYLQKGARILVEGALRFSEWESPEGQKRNKLRVRASRVHFLSAPRNGNENGNGATKREPVAAVADNVDF